MTGCNFAKEDALYIGQRVSSDHYYINLGITFGHWSKAEMGQCMLSEEKCQQKETSPEFSLG